MRKHLCLFLAFVCFASPLFAQGVAGSVRSGGTLPAHCISGTFSKDVFIKSGATAGIYYCSATDTWTKDGGSGSGTVNSGTLGQIGYYGGSGTTLSGATGLFYDSSNARLGVNTTSPSSTLTVISSEVTEIPHRNTFRQYNPTGAGLAAAAAFETYYGSVGSPTAVNVADQAVLSLWARAYDGTNLNDIGSFRVKTAEAQTPTNQGSYAQISTTLIGTSGPRVVAKFDDKANLSFPVSGSGILGTITNDLAAAGNVGEVVSSFVVIGSPVSLTTNVAANITSISLTAGDWDVQGNVNFAGTSATITALTGGISVTSATLPIDGSEVYAGVNVVTTSINASATIPKAAIHLASKQRFSLSVRQSLRPGRLAASAESQRGEFDK